MKNVFCLALALSFCHLLVAQDIYLAIGEGNQNKVREILQQDPGLLNAKNSPGQTPLWKAAETGQLEIARFLLEAGADPAIGDNENTLPFHIAAKSGNIDLFELLHARGFDINVRDDGGVTPLFYAIQGRHPGMVKHILDKGGDVRMKTNQQWPVMLYGAVYGPMETVQLLLDHKADINATTDEGWTPLHSACSYGRTDMVRYLVEKGANINAKTTDGTTLLMGALNPNCYEVVEFLISKGADVNYKNEHGETALMQVAMRGTTSIAQLLLDHGADINAANEVEMTALTRTAWSRKPDEMSRFLILHGARVNPDRTGVSAPLHQAARSGQLEMVKNLVENGAQVNRVDENGYTPLHLAILNKNANIVKLLVEHGAFLNVKNQVSGNTEIHLAAMMGSQEITSYLLDKGADISLSNGEGKTAFDLAWYYGHKELAYVLLARGADDQSLSSYVTAADPLKQPMQPGEATVWFLGHAGWAVKTQNHLLIFDYFLNPRLKSPADSCLASGYIKPEELKDMKVTVFSSHSHGDHYNKAYFAWKQTIPDIEYVFCHRPADATGQYIYIPIHSEQTVRNMKISTIKATDLDGGFLVEVDGLVIVHPGDHANGEDELMKSFTEEVDLLAGKNLSVDILFGPIRGCGLGQPDQVEKGVCYMIETIHPKVFVPMHAGEYSLEYKKVADKLASRQYPAKTKWVAAKGDRFVYRQGDLAEK
jgi:ankyrin repeat protein/L-ascorbate metabolism protein UlaG (beta-lactamase superfamily)